MRRGHGARANEPPACATRARRPAAMLLTKHEGETFQNQTVYISGQAFINCTFIACTLILRETVYHLQNCSFERCNWHVDWVLMWGSVESVREIKALVNLIEQAQVQQNLEGAPGVQSGAGGMQQPTQQGGEGGGQDPLAQTQRTPFA
jgi:hypothetical protein